MEEVILLDEASAARHIGVSEVTLRIYVINHRVSWAERVAVPREGRGGQRMQYRFALEDLDVYIRERDAGNARKGGKGKRRIHPQKAAAILRDLEDPRFSLRKIAKKYGVTHASVQNIGFAANYDFGKRNKRIQNLHVSAEFERTCARLESNPEWYLAVVRQCRDKGISFEPCFIQFKAGSKIRFHRAKLNGRMTHMHVAASVHKTGKGGYAVIKDTDKIPDAGALLAAVSRRDGFRMYVIPGAVVNSCTGISLPIDAMVRPPRGIGPLVPSASQWWHYCREDAWRLFKGG